jgi:uncharacterized membrane protein
MMWDDYGYPMHDRWGGTGWWMVLVMVLFTLLLVGAVLLLLRGWMRAPQPPGGTASYGGLPVRGDQPGAAAARNAAEEVLAERYARGELDEEEFVHRRDVLRR